MRQYVGIVKEISDSCAPKGLRSEFAGPGSGAEGTATMADGAVSVRARKTGIQGKLDGLSAECLL